MTATLSPADRLAAAPDHARVNQVLVRAFVLLRLGGVLEMCLVLGLDWDHYRNRGLPNVVLAAAVAAESMVLITAIWRRGSVTTSWAGGDVIFMLACLPAGAALSSPAWAHTWVYFMYPFTVTSCYVIGIAFTSLWSVTGVTAALSAAYALSAVTIHHEVPWNVLPNAVTYFPNTVMAWLVARELRHSARSADRSRADALAHAAELARERERVRHARLLHDRVLQTLEGLVGRRGVVDEELRRQVAAEAAWLRALVEGPPAGKAASLLCGLQELVEQAALNGVCVELNDAELQACPDSDQIPADVAEAVVGAVREALTNVAKHAQVSRAIVRARIADRRLTVSILDHGRGFDPQQAPLRTGLRHSVNGRVTEVGGQVQIESAPECGTYIELSIPPDAMRFS